MKMQQPKGLYPLFFTEMWERFGFYMVQTILVLYMTKAMGLTDTKAYLLYGTFGSMMYLTPVIGGYLADQFIGFRQAIILGAVLFIIGYAIMAIKSPHALFLGMSFVIIGCGLFKPNVASIVGTLYGPNDPRRDGGFTIFYMGINIGGFFAPLSAGPLVNRLGWHAGYLAASVGLIIGLFTFVRYRSLLGKSGAVPAISPLNRGGKPLFYSLFFAGVMVLIALMYGLFMIPQITDKIIIGVVIAIIGVILFYLFKEEKEERNKFIACLLLIAISIGFWAVYVQTYTSFMLFADRNMVQTFFGLPISAEFTQTFNPFFIVALSPILSRLYVWLDKHGINPTTPGKFTLGLMLMGVGFLVLGSSVKWFNVGGMTASGWLCFSYLFLTVGELLLSPIGLAMITRLAPPHLGGMMMGVWYLTISAGFAIGGGLATFASVPKLTPVIQSSGVYSHAFFLYSAISFAIMLASMALAPYIKGLMGSQNKMSR
jgi:POT family proton-dependent oligopeptide transporter